MMDWAALFRPNLTTPAGVFTCAVWLFFVILALFRLLILPMVFNNRRLKRMIERYAHHRQSKFQQVEHKLSDYNPDEGDIINKSAEELATLMKTGQINVETVVGTFLKRAIEQNRSLNCICYPLTTYSEDVKSILPNPDDLPLYGLPFSVKENFFLKDEDCTVGMAQLIGQPMSEECTFVTVLRDLGAIPTCVTNVPQGLLSFVCSNPVYGTTENPHRHGYTPGGSSGGEAALTAVRGNAFGTGSDVAGSLRIPAAMSGVVAIKPCEDRLRILHSHGGIPGKCRLGLSFGFFTRSVSDQVFLLDKVLNSQAALWKLNPRNSPAGFDVEEIKSTKKLTIGYYVDNGFLQAVPSAQRAVNIAIEKLTAEGYNCVPFEVPDPNDMATLVMKNILPENGGYMKELLNNDIVDQYMKPFHLLLKVPLFIRKFASLFLGFISPQLAIMCKCGNSNVEDLRYMQELTDIYIAKFYHKMQSMNLDAIICPAYPVPAVEHKYPSFLGATCVETGLYNMIDATAGVVPVTKVIQKDIDEVNNDAIFPVGYNPVTSKMREASQGSIGLPVGVQVVTYPYHETTLCRIMLDVERLAGYDYTL